MKFFSNESVTIALLFTSAALLSAASAPSLFASTLVAIGLVGVFGAIMLMGVNRL